jgi:hypothetical protein
MKKQLIIIAGAITTTALASVLNAKIQEKHPLTTTGLRNNTATEGRSISDRTKQVDEPAAPKCVFMTAFEGKGIENVESYPLPEQVVRSMDRGMDWLVYAQNNDGGWGAGAHSRQEIRDPHAVKSDPATTAMVAMAIHREGNTLSSGPHASKLKDATLYLLHAVESAQQNDLNITNLTGTQPQNKLGKNIDVVLTSQFLGNLMRDVKNDQAMHQRVKAAISKCVYMISRGQSADGSQHGSGWAGVLQSSFATSALETAKDAGIAVEEDVLDRSREFQKKNVNVKTNEVVTDAAAGVVLYSASGTARASAKETAEAKKIIEKAKKEGKISNSEVNLDNLRKAGVAEEKALKYNTAYQVNSAANRIAQNDEVITGFGNNGGEEFLSYLQTGEGLIVGNDQDWKSWYDKTSSRLIGIQNNDGSWSGHHCITSPVFCTATCLLILSVSNDIEHLKADNR